MKISYAITVCNELKEIQRLIPYLVKNKNTNDEVIVLFDNKNGSKSVEEFLRAKSINGEFNWFNYSFDGHFANMKNRLTEMCSGDYIYQIDADEMIHEDMFHYLPYILEQNEDVDVYQVPRINTVEGLTQNHIKKWGWRVDKKGWVNYPDYQARVFRNTEDIRWTRPLHEYIKGCKTYAHLPPHEELSLYHPKTKQKQEQQNQFYMDNFHRDLLVRRTNGT